ncbi:unnamed protein product [Brassica napus]|uniref:(rape) hypothetical protein n=1 Tax=Brassica napus TaxID=3708 RepID=A0A816L9B0_BRANA|nr:unnamed protein product [Brassica napus]
MHEDVITHVSSHLSRRRVLLLQCYSRDNDSDQYIIGLGLG